MPSWKKVIISGSNAKLSNLEVDNAITASFFTGSFRGDGSGLTNIIFEGGNVEFAQSSSLAATASYLDLFNRYNGNRGISPQSILVTQGGLTAYTNFATSGSLVDFIDAVFFPNNPPVIGTFPTSSFTIDEFETDTGSLTYIGPGDVPAPIGQLSSSDAIPQNGLLTYETASTYTSGLFGIESITGHLFLNRTASRIDNNSTDPDTGLAAHKLIYSVTDELNETSEFNLFIRIIPNVSPVWSINSDGTGEIANGSTAPFIVDRQESSGSQNNIRRIYFSDANGDDITIRSGSDANTQFDHFTITRGPGYIEFNQITSSLDFETYPSYSFSVTASDEHYEWQGSIRDSGATASINVEIHVQDNIAPTISTPIDVQISETVNDSTAVIILRDNVIDNDNPISQTSFTSVPFTLVSAHSGSLTNPNITESLALSGQSSTFDPARNPFEMADASTGRIERKSSTFLNEEIAKYYVYSATVTDLYNTPAPGSTTELRIELLPDSNPVISQNNNAYIIESALTNDRITTNTTGINNSNPLIISTDVNCDFEIKSTNDFLTIDGAGSNVNSIELLLAKNVSGSIYDFDSNSIISVQVTASKATFLSSRDFFNFDITVTKNNSPEIEIVDHGTNLNTNLARDGATLFTLNVSDPEGDDIDYSTFQLTLPSNFPDTPTDLSSSISPSTNEIFIQVREGQELIASTGYGFTASIQDEHGFRTTSVSQSFAITTGDAITLQTTDYFVNLAATSSEIITNNSTAADNMSQNVNDQGIVFVSFPNSQTYTPIEYSIGGADASFISMSQANNTASLFVGNNISGSALSAGSVINFSISATDVFTNTVVSNLTATVRDVIPPTVNLAIRDGVDMNENAFNGSNAIQLTINKSDTGSLDINDTSLDNITLTGQLASKLTAEGVWSDNGTTYTVNYDGNDANISAGIYDLTASVANVRGFTGSATIDLEISASALPIIISGSDFFVSRGARTGEFILSSETAARTGSRFENVADQGILFVSFSRVDGTPLPISYSFDSGRDVAYISASYNNSTASLKLKENISGSAIQDQDELHFKLKATDQYNNSFISEVTASLIDVQGIRPWLFVYNDPNFLGVAAYVQNWNTNEARSGSRPGGATNTLNFGGIEGNPLAFATYFMPGTFTIPETDVREIDSNTFDNPDQVRVANRIATNINNYAQNVYIFNDEQSPAPGAYQYTSSIFDSRGFVTQDLFKFKITINQAGSGSLDQEGSEFFLIESADTSKPVVTTAAGTASGDNSNVLALTATYNSSEGLPVVLASGSFQGFFTASDSTPYIDITPDGHVSASSALIPSLQLGSTTEIVKLHFEDCYGNIGTGSFNVTFVVNRPPFTSSLGVFTNNLTTNAARNGVDLIQWEVADYENDAINRNDLLAVASVSKSDNTPADRFFIDLVSNIFSLRAAQNPGPYPQVGTYYLTGSLFDQSGTGRVDQLFKEFTIVGSESGSLVQEGDTFFVIETAATDDAVVTTAAGTASINNSNRARLSATYIEPDTIVVSGSGELGFFTSSTDHDTRINVSKDGYISASAALISSDRAGDGANANCKVHFQDQFGNIGTGSFQVSFVVNTAPTITATDQGSFNPNTATGELVKLTFADAESDAINFGTLTFTENASNPDTLVISNNGVTASIRPSATPITAGDYGFTASVQDDTGTGRSGSLRGEFTINALAGLQIGSSGLFVNAGARTGEIISNNQDQAERNPLDTSFVAQITASSPDGGNIHPITYTLAGGAQQQYISLSFADSTASLFVQDNISGSLVQSNIIRFNVAAEDALNNTVTGGFTASVVGVQGYGSTSVTPDNVIKHRGLDENEFNNNGIHKYELFTAPFIASNNLKASYAFDPTRVEIDDGLGPAIGIASNIQASLPWKDVSAGNVSMSLEISGSGDASSFAGQDTKFRVKVFDNRGFSEFIDTTFLSTSNNNQILVAPSGSLNGPTSRFIFEYAEPGDPVTLNNTGRSNQTPAQLSATYDTAADNTGVYIGSFGNPAATATGWFTSSTGHSDEIDITPDGYISASANFVTGLTANIVCRVHFTDQFGNIGTGSFQIQRVANLPPNPPAVTPVTVSQPVTAGTQLATIGIGDQDGPLGGDTPFSASVAGTNAALVSLVPNNLLSSSYNAVAKTDFVGDETSIAYDVTAFDKFGDASVTTPVTQTINPEQALWYAYLMGNGIATLSTGQGGRDYKNTCTKLTGLTSNSDKNAFKGAIADENNIALLNNIPFNASSDTIIKRLANDGVIGDGIISFTDGDGNAENAYLIQSGSQLQSITTLPFIVDGDPYDAPSTNNSIANYTGSDQSGFPYNPDFGSADMSLMLVWPSGSIDQNTNFQMMNVIETAANSGQNVYTNRYTIFRDIVGTGDGECIGLCFYVTMGNGTTYNGRNKFGFATITQQSAPAIHYYLYTSDAAPPDSVLRTTR